MRAPPQAQVRAELEDTMKRMSAYMAAEREVKMNTAVEEERRTCAEADLRRQLEDAFLALEESERALEEARREAAEYKREACEAIQRESAKAMAVQLAMEDHVGIANARVAEAERLTSRWREAHEMAMEAARKSRSNETEVKRKLTEATEQVATAQRRSRVEQLAQAERDHKLYGEAVKPLQQAVSQSMALVREWTEEKVRETQMREARSREPRASMGAQMQQTNSPADQTETTQQAATLVVEDTLQARASRVGVHWDDSLERWQAGEAVRHSRLDEAMPQPARQVWIDHDYVNQRTCSSRTVAFGSTTRDPRAALTPPVPASDGTPWSADMSHPSMPPMLSKFVACFNICAKDDPDAKSARAALFRRFSSTGRGYLSLAETCSGVLSALSSKHGQEASTIYRRYYRSFIRAFNDAKDSSSARPGCPDDDNYVTRSEFRLLLVYLCIYATWYETFAHVIDVGGPGLNVADALPLHEDHRASRAEWNRALPTLRRAGQTWAPYIRLREASTADFDAIDCNGGGYIDFREFCEWIEMAEKAAGTPAGLELGVNEPSVTLSSMPEALRDQAHVAKASDQNVGRIHSGRTNDGSVTRRSHR